MTKEAGPQDYQFKHTQRISMNSYNGIASDRMQLHDPTADGFMRVADMRRDIVVTQKVQSKTYNYDQLGSIKIAKILEIPRIGRGESGVLHTRKEDGMWVVEIDDRKLWEEVGQKKGRIQQREDQFMERFRSEVLKGIGKFLVEEKLFNGGIYSPIIPIGIISSLFDAIPIVAEIDTIALGNHSLEIDLSSIGFVAINHMTFNTLSWFFVTFNEKIDKLFPAMSWLKDSTQYQEPWVRHKFPEFLMPPVPVDRLVRGAVYLKRHGKDLIQT